MHKIVQIRLFILGSNHVFGFENGFDALFFHALHIYGLMCEGAGGVC